MGTRLMMRSALVGILGLGLVLGLMAILPAGAAADIPDDTITNSVKSTISGDPALAKREIEVSTFRGRVSLVGFVDNQREADRAVELARNADGVKSVQNNLMYLAPMGKNIIPRAHGFQSP